METERSKVLTEFNEAFAKSDVDTILRYVTDDVKWNMVGDRVVEGKENFAGFIKEMASEDPMDFRLDPPINAGEYAVLEGRMTSSAGKVYAFCDIYTFDGKGTEKIRNLTSYVVEVPDKIS